MESKTYWQWQVKEERGRWRTLGWRMTSEEAAAWAAAHGKELRKVPGTAETRRPEDRASGLMRNLGTRR